VNNFAKIHYSMQFTRNFAIKASEIVRVWVDRYTPPSMKHKNKEIYPSYGILILTEPNLCSGDYAQ
jgi:hypothetical protein